MTAETVFTWEEFKTESTRIRAAAFPLSPILFRGQRNADWDLETTLERSGHQEDVAAYYRLISRIRTEIEITTKKSWQSDVSVFDLEKMASQYDDFSRALSNLPHYAYMAYLRHHGFPSPLLDWSRSPFIAAYFAFRADVDLDQNVAIYAFADRTTSIKSSSSESAQIHRLGPYVAAHQRHFSQQSEYTICVKYSASASRWSFVSHSNVFDSQDKEGSQDVIRKFVLRSEDRRKVLQELNDYNLNSYSLFQSEEGLMESLSNREELKLST